MNRSLSVAAATALLAAVASSAAQAQSVEISGEAAVSLAFPMGGGGTEAVFEGAVAFAHSSGLYLGFGVETLNGAAPDSADLSIALGFGTEIAPGVELGIEYARHYLDMSGFDTHELVLGIAFPLGDRWGAETEVVYDIPTSNVDASVALGVDITDRLSAGFTVGHDGAVVYGDVGLGYALSDNAAVTGTIEWEEGAGSTFVLGFELAFGG